MSPITTTNLNLLLQSLPMANDGKSFVAYRLPHDTYTHVLVGTAYTTSSLADVLGKEGFVFMAAVNSHKHQSYFVAPEQRWVLEDLSSVHFPHNVWPTGNIAPIISDQSTYLAQAEAIVEAIKNDGLEKAILSRIKKQEVANFNPWETFKRLCAAYAGVMVYWVSIPGEGTWLGATPETLLRLEDGLAETVALAGTQADKGLPLENVTWGEKEQAEQQIVSDYIESQIHHYYPAVALDVDGPNTVSTGALLHVKTIFRWRTPHDISALEAFLLALHPTPAIVGQPQETALDVIADTEQHDRAFYTGLIGPVDTAGLTHLFVNLRCMQVFDTYLALYLGGGITAASNPEAEWHETELKAQTLLKAV